MKRAREEDKVAGPLFPRLHVNDADKGGPRAPPRNKMALYEQFSIPSQRFSSSSSSTLPFPPHHGSSLVPSISSSQGCGNERSVSSSFYLHPHMPSHATERAQDQAFSTEGSHPDAMKMGFQRRPSKPAASRGTVSGECSSPLPRVMPSVRQSSAEKQEDEDDFQVPIYVQRGVDPSSNRDRHLADKESNPWSHSSSSHKNGPSAFRSSDRAQNGSPGPLQKLGKGNNGDTREGDISGETKSIESIPHPVTRGTNTHPSAFRSSDRAQNGSPGPLQKLGKGNNGDTREGDISGETKSIESIPHPVTRGTNTHPSGPSVTSSNPDHQGGKLSEIGSLHGRSSVRVPAGEDRVVGEDAERSGSSGSPAKISSSRDAAKDGSPRHAIRTGDVSETSMADSVAGANISPDNVAGVIGPKHFWKARRAIINQQRVFALQVFELHKLMKVQKLLAASPQLLLEDPSSFHGSSTLMASAKDKPADSSVKGGQKPFPREEEVGEEEDEPSRVNGDNGDRTEEDDGSNGSGGGETTAGELHRDGPPPSAPAASESKPGPWFLQLPGNQWLVPVMSPTEGLIYKPFAGGCPPAAAFMAPPPVYGGDFTSSPYLGGAVPPGFMAAPYGLPPATPSVSGSMVDQAGSFHWRRHLEQRPLTSSNRSNQRSELQSSTASSAAGGTPPLPPAITPVVDPSRGLARVIKVVPHNPKSASESAVRIFQSIQKERQHYDPL
ncbi:unnamed protein product [Spirodela intermedia]|uniref:Uncharacterized protein n=1 Tax=Spirodela intermedia TaxID=51605 RepID=A0A7I8KJE0_SPIIN|nr:unnamed protein product [Spirodela intermedia]